MKDVELNLGAVNIIDNTTPISFKDAKFEDFMMQHNPGAIGGYTGHTMIIGAIFSWIDGIATTWVTWYQGNDPPQEVVLKTETVEVMFQKIHEGLPRRWNFNSFNQ